ncbi:MAG TPA: arylamine N-acetyltransferase [Polyangiaceae bacterium]|nr:arylamine N-acetyltransferase [Polyangiaceae bacterium]
MNAEPYDVKAYCARIGYDGDCTPDYDVLAALVEHHALALPFENLDVLLGRPILLDALSLQEKLIQRRRGGYCFEHNTLLAGVLERIGFDVKRHMGRGRWRVPEGVTLPRTHMVLTIGIGGVRFLVDGGYGGVGLTSPLALGHSEPQPSLFEAQRVLTFAHERLVQALVAGEWRDLYTFTDEPLPPIDFEVANWYTATHPASRFRQNLIVSSATREARFVLYNRELTTYGRGTKEARTVDDPEELLVVLSSRFDLTFPEGMRFGEPGSPWARS